MQKHRYRTGRTILYCSNEQCESRIGSPIEKELARQKERANAKTSKDADVSADTNTKTRAKRTASSKKGSNT